MNILFFLLLFDFVLNSCTCYPLCYFVKRKGMLQGYAQLDHAAIPPASKHNKIHVFHLSCHNVLFCSYTYIFVTCCSVQFRHSFHSRYIKCLSLCLVNPPAQGCNDSLEENVHWCLQSLLPCTNSGDNSSRLAVMEALLSVGVPLNVTHGKCA